MIQDRLQYQKELTDRLDAASRLYYDSKTSEFTDTEFDLKMKELQELERQNSKVFPNSPTLRVGSDLRKEFGKVQHPNGYPMLTIENAYDDDELLEWFLKMHKEYGVEEYDVTLKYDGISCELRYDDSYLVSASTRGDRLVGDDITENVRTLKSVPLKIKASGEVYFRGEILLPKTMLKSINEARNAAGENLFANCRNACSGSIKQLDSRVTASRGLVFRPWDCFFTDGRSIDRQSDKAKIFIENGFVLDDGTVSRIIKVEFDSDGNIINPKVVVDSIKWFWDNVAKKQDYDCDGIVIKVNDCKIQSSIGTKDHRAIEWGIARKWNEEKKVVTVVNDVDFQVGTHGAVTPVAKLEPVPCDGVIISNATLNNEKFIKDNKIHVGDELYIVRSGGVIPYVVGNKTAEEMAECTDYTDGCVEFPKCCPECCTPLVKEGEIWKCPNIAHCPAQKEGRIEQWCSKDGMDIAQLGPEMIHDLVEKKLVNDPLDLYVIARDYTPQSLVDVLEIGYGLKKVKKFIENVNASKTRTFDKVLYSLCISGIGKQNAKMIAEKFRSYQNLRNATKEQLMELDGIGEVLANSIIEWFKDNDSDGWYLNGLKEHGLSMEMNVSQSVAQNEQILSGLNIVFSGKSGHWNGDDVEVVLSSYGAKCGHSVSKKTDYLVIGENPGPSKVSKAQSLGVEIIKEDDFIVKMNIPLDNFQKTEKEFVFPDDLESQEESESLF